MISNKFKGVLLDKIKSPLFKDSFYQFLLNSGVTATTFVQIPILIKALSLNGFGYLVICQTVGAIWSTLTIVQFNQGIMAFAAGDYKKDMIIRWAFMMSIVNYIVSMMVFIIIFYLLNDYISISFSDIISKDLQAVVPVVLSASLISSPFLGAVYRLNSRYHEFMSAQLLTALVRLGIIFLCMSNDLGVFEIAWLAFLMPEILKIIILWSRIKGKLIKGRKLDKGMTKRIFRLSVAMNFHSISDLPTQQLDKIILLPIIGLNNVGIYQSVKRIGLLTSMLTGPFSGSLFHEYSILVNNVRHKMALKLFHKTLIPFFLLTGFFSLSLWLTRSTWLPIMLPGAQISDDVLVSILVLYCVASSFVGLHPLLIALKVVKSSLLVTILTNILFLILAGIFAPSLATLGVIVALYAQIGILLFVKYWKAKKYLESLC